MQKHEQWDRRLELADLQKASLGRAYLYVSNSVRRLVTAELALPFVEAPETVPSDAETLIVIGGGASIDRAKYFRMSQWPALRLVAVPSIWGSGAEVSPVAVLNRETGKDIHCSDDLIPDNYVVWPALARSASAERLRFSCGDVWAHALEAFCSPLASDDIRSQAAAVMNEMADYPLAFDDRWFDASAAACLLQARSSVGLIHGFAHVLEPRMPLAAPAEAWGHARLCSTFLLPVLRFNLWRSSRVEGLAQQYGLRLDRVLQRAESLFHDSDYAAALRIFSEHWELIARDRCSRTNCVLVRRDSLPFFQQFRASGVSA